MERRLKAISLFSGAGGMDVGFKNAGIDIVVANEIDKDASNTYEKNHPESLLIRGDIREVFTEIIKFKDIDIVFGGPPCQGFSVAGKMDPNDERSTLVWSFLDVVKLVKPKAFVIENVKALGTLEKWRSTREEIFKRADEMGYSCNLYVLNSANFAVPQKRERVFFIGFLDKNVSKEKIEIRLSKLIKEPKSVRETIQHLGPAGTDKNPHTCTAKITFATNPVLRKSPYAGMIFNGMGRPLDVDEASNTLPASMGGNKTPIVDEEYLHGGAEINWVEEYHKNIMENKTTPNFEIAPERLRRLTINEAALIQTFPEDYKFEGSKSAIYRQIGNAVPCLLAHAVAETVKQELANEEIEADSDSQLSLDDFIEEVTGENVQQTEGIIAVFDGIIDIK